MYIENEFFCFTIQNLNSINNNTLNNKLIKCDIYLLEIRNNVDIITYIIYCYVIMK